MPACKSWQRSGLLLPTLLFLHLSSWDFKASGRQQLVPAPAALELSQDGYLLPS